MSSTARRPRSSRPRRSCGGSGPDDRVLAGLSIGFDASCEEMWLAWRNGAALVPAPPEIVRSGADLGPWLADHGITVVSTVPTLAALWDEAHLDRVRLLILGGEACPEQLGWRLAAQQRGVEHLRADRGNGSQHREADPVRRARHHRLAVVRLERCSRGRVG